MKILLIILVFIAMIVWLKAQSVVDKEKSEYSTFLAIPSFFARLSAYFILIAWVAYALMSGKNFGVALTCLILVTLLNLRGCNV